MFTIEYTEMAANHLAELRAFDRKRILGQIDAQLTHQPMAETRNRKKLMGVRPLGNMWSPSGSFALVNTGCSTM